MTNNENPSRSSSASTLDGARPNGLNEKTRDERDVTHDEDQMPLPTEVEDENERAQIMRRMSQNALNAMLENPLHGKPRETVIRDARRFARDHGMAEDEEDFVKGALVAQNPDKFEDIPELSDEDKAALRFEITHKWRQPFTLYFLVVMCSMAAVVQGMDETVVNGAQLYYVQQFDIQPPRFSQSQASWIVGLVNSGPYLACAVLGCWLTEPLNSLMGRRGVIFLSCFIAGVASIWEGVSNSWVNLFIARFVLGLGIGSKSTTVPVYTAETTPAPIRGALVMMWQMWTAFGIMLGYIVDAALIDVRSDLNWRLMLGSTVIAPIIVCAQVYFCPESPRWYLKKKRVNKAYQSFRRLRPTRVQAARDLYYAYVNIQVEESIKRGRNLVTELFTVPRNRRAAMASWIVMFMQQFCGVNVIAYYSSVIFVQDGGFTQRDGILASLGAGIINWLFAIPAIYTIDTFGRRNLLLTTFPLMSLCLWFTGSSFYIPAGKARLGCVALGIYLFMIVYSPGEGPVPFTYSAECYPLYVRDVGMSFATATTWFFNFVLSITWPSLQNAFTISGAFYWYAAWNIVGWWLILLFVPETKALTLEELDQVFSVPTRKHATYQLGQAKRWFRKYLLRQKVGPKEELYKNAENAKPLEV